MVETLREIEYANPQTLPLLYQYKYKIKEEDEEQANEVTQEYKSGMMDPSRDAAKFEKTRMTKKSVGKKKDYEDKLKKYKDEKSYRTGINYLSML